MALRAHDLKVFGGKPRGAEFPTKNLGLTYACSALDSCPQKLTAILFVLLLLSRSLQ